MHDTRSILHSQAYSRSLGIVFLHPQYVRSWIQTGILRELTIKQDVKIFSSIDVLDSLVSSGIDKQKILITPRPGRLAAMARTLRQKSFKEFSAVWYFSQRRHYLGLKIFPPRKIFTSSHELFTFIQSLRGTIVRLTKAPLGIFNFFIPAKIAKKLDALLTSVILSQHQWRQFVIELSDVDLLLIPSNNAEDELELVLNGLRNAPTKTLVAIDNWDNLTSKRGFRTKPDFISVMGPSSVWRAINAYGFAPENVLPWGLPKFELILRKNPRSRSANIKRVAYMGFAQNQREYDFVNSLQSLVSQFDKVTLDYRPHPFRITMPLDEGQLDSNVLLYRHNRRDLEEFGNYPRLGEDYTKSLLNYDLVVSGPSTIVLETVALGIPTIVDLRYDSELLTAPGNTLGLYSHFQDIFLIQGLQIFSDLAEGISMVETALKARRLVASYSHEAVFPTTPYFSHLSEFISKR